MKKYKKKLWFKIYSGFIKLFRKKTTYVYLGKKITTGAVIVSNHVGTSAPLSWSFYTKLPIRPWGAYQMNNGLIKMYKYQTRVYYHEKKHWNLHLARVYCLFASPLTNMFYKGLNLISTYPDARFRNTIKESIQSLKDQQNIVIFPEDSTKGYLDVLEGFHKGFVVFLKTCLKNNIDPDVYVSYFKKQNRVYVVDKPIKASELFKDNQTDEQIAQKLCDRCNELGKMEIKNND